LEWWWTRLWMFGGTLFAAYHFLRLTLTELSHSVNTSIFIN
jgi:hypothetical protein